MPVLVWLAIGLRSGLPPAATEKAHEMACALLGVVSAVLPDEMTQALAQQQHFSQPDIMQTASSMVAQLGSVGKGTNSFAGTQAHCTWWPHPVCTHQQHWWESSQA
jgi:hypothetical protein